MRFTLSLTALLSLATLAFAAKGDESTTTDVFNGGDVQTKLAWFPPMTRPSYVFSRGVSSMRPLI